MKAFDFLKAVPPYDKSPGAVLRLEKRYKMLVEPYRDQIKGARVLDLGAHDGRWCYALARAGARQVVGIEARLEPLERFASFPDARTRKKIDLRLGDVFEALESLVADGEQFDVVAVFGLFYHIMDHFRLLQLIRLLGAPLVLMDSEFMRAGNPMIQLVFEETGKDLNASPQIDGQRLAIVGVPSFRALKVMAEALGYDVVWARVRDYLGDDRKGVQDYYQTEQVQRAGCALIARDD